MRLLTWNLNGRRDVEKQTAAIAARSADVVALQELTKSSTTLWRNALRDTPIVHIVDSFAASPRWDAVGARRYGLLIASRFPLAFIAPTPDVHWPERLLSVQVAAPSGAFDVHTTHIPPGCTNGWTKVYMLEAAAAVVANSSGTPCILCGDFNVPQAETPTGRIVTWAERLTTSGEPRLSLRKRGQDARRWDNAERTVMEGGVGRNLVDAFRHIHGYGRQEFSWCAKRGQLLRGRRFDHVFCSRDFVLERCDYLHDMRIHGLSDHAALEVDFEL